MTNEAMVHLTDSATEHVKKVLAKDADGIGLRLGVKTSGCSGYQYLIETATAVREQDRTLESNGITIVIDDESLRYLAGSELDFIREGLNSGFKFHNPNTAESCGCGQSFSLRENTGAEGE